MDGSHRTRIAGQRRRPGAHTTAAVAGSAARHAAPPRRSGTHSPPPRTHAGGTHTKPQDRTHSRPQTRSRSAQAHSRAAARERMLQRRRRSLGALSMLVLVVTVAITLTRPAPERAAAVATSPLRNVPSDVYAASAPAVPAGADATGVRAAELTPPSGSAIALTAKPRTWTQPAGATIHCPITVTACVDLKAKITWLQHGSTIVLGPVRMQPGEGVKRTPRGTFTINKKAAVYFSHTYGGAMPYSVFWGHDGIAYHEGSLTGFSHGCIHLSMANAKRFFAALHKGEKVYVS